MLNLDMVLFGALPYVALFLFVIGSAYRYFIEPFTFSSLSSQFLENDQHFWEMGPFHFGVIIVLLGHLFGFLFPGLLLLWNAGIWRLFALEVFALVFGILTLAGIAGALARRLTVSKVAAVTTPTDWVLLSLLLFQGFSGVYIAVFNPWGSTWFAALMTPYLWSILTFVPQVASLAALPLMVKLHVFTAIVILGIFPFTRLAHIIVAPIHYYWRKPQVVRWYGTIG